MIIKKFLRWGMCASGGKQNLSKGYIAPDVFKGILFSVFDLYMFLSRTDLP